MTQRCIIALDFDGVLHPAKVTMKTTDKDGPFCRLDLLLAWLRERPTVDVVISSSWRENHSFTELQGYFWDDLQPRIKGVTPVLKPSFWAQKSYDERPVYEREAEIRQRLREDGTAHCPWVALDDQAELFAPFCEHLVLCDGRVGLTPRDLEMADKVLGASDSRLLDIP